MRFLKGLLSPLPLIVAVAVTLIGTAGWTANAWTWPRAWIFLALYGGGSMMGMGVLAVVRPASYQVRRQAWVAGKKQPLIDVLGLGLYAAFVFGWFAFIPLDVFRLRLMAAPSAIVSDIGLVVLMAGVVTVYSAIGQNPFAAPTIHDQSDSGQRVIDSGLYGVVRHPFYAGMLLVYLGAALWLGSYAAAIAVAGFLAMTLARIVIEERWLRDHLPDYAAYARRVRGRLIPYLL